VKQDHTLDISSSNEVYNPSDDSYLLLKILEVSPGQSFLDMGCGTGLIGLHAARLGADVVAVDINPHAVEYTKRNASANGVKIRAIESDLFDKVPGHFDVISFNPPYLPGKETSTSWVERAWSGGEEGSEVAIRFLDQAWEHLNPGGSIYVILSSIGGLMSAMRSARNHYDIEMLEEQHMFFESIYAYRMRLRQSMAHD
jgi:release factor glutamine methyltransferase